MSPSSAFKALTTKVNTKLEKVKCRLHKTKAAKDETQVTVEPSRVKEGVQETVITFIPEYTSEDSHELAQPPGCETRNKQQKTAKKQARREARKAKWAARRTIFKGNAKKVSEALFLPAAVVGGIVLAPVILVVDVVLFVVKLVVWLVMKIVDLLICGPALVRFVRK